MTLNCRLAFLLFVSGAFGLFGQSTPTITASIPAQAGRIGGAPIAVDLRNYFNLPGVVGTVVQFNTVEGRFNVELDSAAAPQHVANFLRYVDAGAYTNTFFHRTAYFSASPPAITQAGGYRLPYATPIPQFPPIALEGSLLNARGTIAAARLSAPTNSATSQFYFNTKDNSVDLPPASQGGYSVFGRVIGTGMTVVDTIAGYQTYVTSMFGELPLRNVSGTTVQDQFLLVITSITSVPIYPTGSGASVITFTAQSSNSAVAAATTTGSTLNVAPGSQAGAATITVRATDTNGNFATSTFTVTVAAAEVAPVIARGPNSQALSAGNAVAFDVSATGNALTYQWKHDNQIVAGANEAILLLKSLTPADAGVYTVIVSNGGGSVTSAGATLTVAATGAPGRLTNLSLRSQAGLGDQTLIAGFSIGGSGTEGLVVRGIGPTLSAFGVQGFLDDPRLDVYNSTGGSVTSNDNWSGADGRAVGGFALPAGSKDSVVSTALTAGGYTAQVKGANGSTGEALVEIYESPSAESSAELINLSARTQINSGQVLTTGFTVASGSNRTFLIRAVGPGLVPLGVGNALSNPKIELYNSTGTKIGENDDWGGGPVLTQAMAGAGAFGIQDPASKDAMVLVTLPPGGYTALVSGVDSSSGVVIVELYVIR